MEKARDNSREREEEKEEEEKDLEAASAGGPATCSAAVLFEAPWFAVLVAAWLVCGLVVAAWLLYARHSEYVAHRDEALGVWCKERALMLQQLVLTHAGQTQTLAGIISVMGKPGQTGRWELNTCLNGSTWGTTSLALRTHGRGTPGRSLACL
ncbi:hypothetical protein CLOM_g23148 [Closterium sp. NIES-68]|nr:hypothetical protein CLOM_g23148 [Closterium sp. NIES-68]